MIMQTAHGSGHGHSDRHEPMARQRGIKGGQVGTDTDMGRFHEGGCQSRGNGASSTRFVTAFPRPRPMPIRLHDDDDANDPIDSREYVGSFMYEYISTGMGELSHATDATLIKLPYWQHVKRLDTGRV